MSKRVLTILLAVMLAATFGSVVARADVEGSFDFKITMEPQDPYQICFVDTYVDTYRDCVNEYTATAVTECIAECTTDCVNDCVTESTVECIAECETKCDATCTTECDIIPADIAAEAHAVKAKMEEIREKIKAKEGLEDMEDEWWADLYQELLELADLTEEAELQAKVAEIKEKLDALDEYLEEHIAAVEEDIPVEVKEFIDTDPAAKIEAIGDAIGGWTDTGLVKLVEDFEDETIWADVADAFTALLALFTDDFVQTGGVTYYKPDVLAAQAEWENIRDKVSSLSAIADELAAKTNKVVFTNRVEGLVDDLVEAFVASDLDAMRAALNALNDFLDELNEELDDLEAIATELKAEYKPFMLMQLGQGPGPDPYLVTEWLSDQDLDISKLAPGGEIYTINDTITSIKADKDEIEDDLDEIKDKYENIDYVKEIISEKHEAEEELQKIPAKEWTADCETICTNDCATECVIDCIEEATTECEATCQTDCENYCETEVELHKEQFCTEYAKEYAHEQCVTIGEENKETTVMEFDFEGLLTLDVTLSGLTFSNDIAFGVAGVEHYVADLATTLGALDLKDEFVFAAPYIMTAKKSVAGKTIASYTGGYRVGPLLFVKKRVTAEMTIGGLTVSSLFMFEDVNFPSPRASTFPDLDIDGDYDAADQLFGAGAIITISGTTVSGITVTSQTGLCADWAVYAYYPRHKLFKVYEWDTNEIKKKTWYETVEADCAVFGGIPTEYGGWKTSFFFSKEVISVSGIPLPAGITSDLVVLFQPKYDIPFMADITFTMTVAGIVDLLVEFHTTDPDIFTYDMAVWTMDLPPVLTVHWYDLDGDLTLTATDKVLVQSEVAFQDVVTVSTDAAFKPTIGLDDLYISVELPISYPEPIGTLALDFDWDLVDDQLKFTEWSVKLSKEFGPHNYFEIVAGWEKYRFVAAGITVGVTWSI